MITSLALDPAIAADLAHRPWAGGWFPWFPIIPLVVVALWLLVVGVVLRRRWRPRPTQSGERVLADRYARGEIDEAEYRARRAVLRDRG